MPYVHRLYLLVLAAEIAVACILLVVLRSPVPVLIALGLIYLGSFFFIRTLSLEQR